MARYQVHRSDTNAKDLKKVAEQLGMSVEEIGRPVDWLVGAYGLTVACEVKTDKGKLRAGQESFLRAFKGHATVLRTVEDVVRLHNRLKWRADRLSVSW